MASRSATSSQVPRPTKARCEIAHYKIKHTKHDTTNRDNGINRAKGEAVRRGQEREPLQDQRRAAVCSCLGAISRNRRRMVWRLLERRPARGEHDTGGAVRGGVP